MSGTLQVLTWLKQEGNSHLAEIMHAIRKTESQLHVATGKIISIHGRDQHKHYCQQLITYYNQLKNKNNDKLSNENFIAETLLVDCYHKIRQLQDKLCVVHIQKSRQDIVNRLVFYYENYIDLLSASPTNPQVYEQKPLQELLSVKNTKEWLWALWKINHWLDKKNQSVACFFSATSEVHLISLYQQFTKSEFIELCHAIYIYQTRIGDLIECTNFENVIKSQQILAKLYQFIETLYQLIVQRLHSYGFGAGQDYLIHGNLLPLEVNVQVNLPTTRMLREFLQAVDLSMERIDLPILFIEDILLCYKYWFKPKRLIDLCVSLYYHLTGQRFLNKEIADFSNALSIVFGQISTTLGLELYGYFSNKDTKYLLRTLYAASVGNNILGFSAISSAEKELFARIYSLLQAFITGLIAELSNRHLVISPIDFDKKKAVVPGKRNLMVLQHILNLYKHEQGYRNEKLEGAFQLMENNQR